MVTRAKRKRRRIVIDLTEEDTLDGPDDVTEFDPNDSDEHFTSQPDAPSQQSKLTPADLSEPHRDSDPRTWVDKYSSSTLQRNQPISSRKRAQIHEWLSRALDHSGPELLILAGPPGCGKSSTVRAVAQTLNCSIATWKAPVPGFANISRTLLDDFQDFFVSTRYSSLSLADDNDVCVQPLHTRRLLLIDDMPVTLTDSHAKRDALKSTLSHAAMFAPHPTVLILSDCDKGIARTVRLILSVELIESSHVTSLKIPPVTDLAMKRILHDVLSDHCLSLTPSQLQAVISSSNGDVRSALNTLQFSACINNTERREKDSISRNNFRSGKRRLTPSTRTRISPVADIGLDATLGTYHAVSKILNNKRTSQGDSKYVAEDVLEDARADPSSFLAFLHHNYPAFFGDVDDAVSALEALSDADNLLPWRQDDTARSALYECAASVATRGFLCYNRSPIRSGWRPIRGPESFQVAKEGREYVASIRQKFARVMAPQVFVQSTTCESLPFAELIAEVRRTNLGISRRSVSFVNGGGVADAADIAMVDVENEELAPVVDPQVVDVELCAGDEVAMDGAEEDIEEWDDH